MPPLPSVSVLTHHQSLREGWFLSQDSGWRYLMDSMVPSHYHRAYIDGLVGRWLTGEYDALACLDIYRRLDHEAYVADLREQLDEYRRRPGRGLHAGRGGYHHDAPWNRAKSSGELSNLIFQCRRPLFDSDSPPWSPNENGRGRRPVRALVDAMIGDAFGATNVYSTRATCIHTEDAMWPILGCESRTNAGGYFCQAAKIGRPQYSQDDTARMTDASMWDFLQRTGMDDHSILMTDGDENIQHLADWHDRGFHLVYPVDAWRRGAVGGAA